MKILSLQQVLAEKEQHLKKIKGISRGAQGRCIHIGKISPGCQGCFDSKRVAAHPNIIIGPQCNSSCPYCSSYKATPELSAESIKRTNLSLAALIHQKDTKVSALSFSGGGETLLYTKVILDYLDYLKPLAKKTKQKPWYYLYTNGLLATPETLLKLKKAGINEIRFHLGASNFSEQVYKNIRAATSIFDTVSVETPSWPKHRQQLFAMLPRIQDLGVKHLNIGEIEINKHNLAMIQKELPRARVYQCYELQLYDEGLVYDLMEEHQKKKYTFSMLDCNSLVKLSQRGQAKETTFSLKQ